MVNADERKFLEGELNFAQGKTTIKNFLKTFAKELITQQWIEYNRNETDHAWVNKLFTKFYNYL